MRFLSGCSTLLHLMSTPRGRKAADNLLIEPQRPTGFLTNSPRFLISTSSASGNASTGHQPLPQPRSACLLPLTLVLERSFQHRRAKVLPSSLDALESTGTFIPICCLSVQAEAAIPYRMGRTPNTWHWNSSCTLLLPNILSSIGGFVLTLCCQGLRPRSCCLCCCSLRHWCPRSCAVECWKQPAALNPATLCSLISCIRTIFAEAVVPRRLTETSAMA